MYNFLHCLHIITYIIIFLLYLKYINNQFFFKAKKLSEICNPYFMYLASRFMLSGKHKLERKHFGYRIKKFKIKNFQV